MGDPKYLGFIYKKLWIYSYMFKLQSPSKYSPFDVIHLLRCSFHCSKQFLNSSILMPFRASAIFFVSPFSGKCFPLRTFFIRGNKKKVTWGKIGWIGRVGQRGHVIFGQKLLNTQCGQVLIYHPLWNGQMCWKNLLKNFTEAKHSLSQQSQLVHWYRRVPRTLT